MKVITLLPVYTQNHKTVEEITIEIITLLPA